MTRFGKEEDCLAAVLGEGADVEVRYGQLTATVPAERWIEALTAARDALGCRFFDWLSAVDELDEGFDVYAHVAAVRPGGVERLLIRTRIPRTAAVLPSAVAVWPGAAWHERETHEMFGIGFDGHPGGLAPLLLPDGFEGHPLRKEFVLAARVAKAWPGAKEPGESEHAAGGRRRKMLPPGVPDPNTWGPDAGTLPPEPPRGARGAAAGRGPAGRERPGAAAAGTEAPSPGGRGDRPRRNRSASAGSASQRPEPAGEAPGDTDAPPPGDRPRRNRSASAGSASRRPAEDAPWSAAPDPSAPDPSDDPHPEADR